ncbi:MAG: hypothetical protein J6V28_05875 [Tidjanibacter sp.]|nr:hypothetical protein [Tidjanibacter sp.]MBQ2247661.1 hypothetical protein [Tidjanibacter sp.]
MKHKTTITLLEVVTLIAGVAIVGVRDLWAPQLLPVGWIIPAFFYLYEIANVLLVGRYERMTPQRMLLWSMVMRGVKFLGVAVLLLVWVSAELPEKNVALLYTLGFYLLTSLLEGWEATARVRTMTKK